jgi:hypothetical protein
METDVLTLNLEKELCILMNKKKVIHFGKSKFGFVSNNNSRYTGLWKRIVEFANKYIMCKYNAVNVLYQNTDIINEEHIFFGSGYATAISLGDYKGGFMEIDELTYDCKYSPYLLNLKNMKLNTISSGFRFFLVFYTI